mmetsp:Transcript_31282/g.76934  ORF Transcript_31282/g.76934 Transcript_31282/m.76934 type:complete len:319 (-) Transcript_31282:31-987(-)
MALALTTGTLSHRLHDFQLLVLDVVVHVGQEVAREVSVVVHALVLPEKLVLLHLLLHFVAVQVGREHDDCVAQHHHRVLCAERADALPRVRLVAEPHADGDTRTVRVRVGEVAAVREKPARPPRRDARATVAHHATDRVPMRHPRVLAAHLAKGDALAALARVQPALHAVPPVLGRAAVDAAALTRWLSDIPTARRLLRWRIRNEEGTREALEDPLNLRRLARKAELVQVAAQCVDDSDASKGEVRRILQHQLLEEGCVVAQARAEQFHVYYSMCRVELGGGAGGAERLCVLEHFLGRFARVESGNEAAAGLRIDAFL